MREVSQSGDDSIFARRGDRKTIQLFVSFVYALCLPTSHLLPVDETELVYISLPHLTHSLWRRGILDDLI